MEEAGASSMISRGWIQVYIGNYCTIAVLFRLWTFLLWLVIHNNPVNYIDFPHVEGHVSAILGVGNPGYFGRRRACGMYAPQEEPPPIAAAEPPPNSGPNSSNINTITNSNCRIYIVGERREGYGYLGSRRCRGGEHFRTVRGDRSRGSPCNGTIKSRTSPAYVK